jgi:hypothetical protein
LSHQSISSPATSGGISHTPAQTAVSANKTPNTYLKIKMFHIAKLWFSPSVEGNSAYLYFLLHFKNPENSI